MADAEPAPYVAYYDTTQLRGGGWSVGAARAQLAKDLRKNHLALFLQSADGTESEVSPSSRRLEPGTTIMAMVFLEEAEPGAEVDSVVAGSAQDLLLATFWWEPGRLLVAQRHHHALLRPDGPTEAELRQRYPIGKLVSVDSGWDPVARGLVEEAYQHLSEPERELLSYIALHRVREGMGEPAAARYFGEDGRIELYDMAVADQPSFVGELTAPEPYSLKVLLHELGHGFMYAPDRTARVLLEQIRTGRELDQATVLSLREAPASEALQARIAALQEKLAARNEAEQALVEWLGSNPVLDAYALAIGAEQAPTQYGRTRGVEGFAEAFALWHLDHAALVRAAPKAAAFFDAGNHLEAAEAGTVRVQELASRGL